MNLSVVAAAVVLGTIHEALADGSLHGWTGAIRGVHQAVRAVRAGGAG